MHRPLEDAFFDYGRYVINFKPEANPVKIACAQMRVVAGKPEINFAKMSYFVKQARQQGCSIVAFPEMCVGGYLLGDRWTEESWCRYLMSFNKRICEQSDDIVIIYGNIYVDSSGSNKDGRVRKFNAGYAWYQHAPLKNSIYLPDGISIKTLLPNYRIFDDERYFISLQEYSSFLGVSIEQMLYPFTCTINGELIRIGIEICEDLWFKDYYYNKRPLNVSRILIENGADLIFNLSASPWTYGKNQARNNRIRDAFKECTTFKPFFYVNCTGVQNNGKNFVTFDGDSTIYNQNADIILAASEPYKDELLVYDSTLSYPSISKPCPSIVKSKFRAAIEGIRGMDELQGRSDYPFIIGLSGGVDSALVACLVEQACDRSRIIAYTLPSKYNSTSTRTSAESIAQKLGISLQTIPIDALVHEHTKLLAQFSPSEFNMENIQAKIRGTSILSNIAGITGGVMTNNGNKVEIALGYATLYGDVNGAIAPIGDLLKTEVFACAAFLNAEIYAQEVIPYSLLPDDLFKIKMPPSAELKSNQIDPMKWGYHDALIRVFTDYSKTSPETILEWYRMGTLCACLEIDERLYYKYRLSDCRNFIDDLEWVVTSLQRAVFKRIQGPPIIILSKGSFGFDIRESQLPVYYSDTYRNLRNELLNT